MLIRGKNWKDCYSTPVNKEFNQVPDPLLPGVCCHPRAAVLKRAPESPGRLVKPLLLGCYAIAGASLGQGEGKGHLKSLPL